MRVSRFLRAPQRDPFKILGLTRSATKSEVKIKYRELARLYHPDAQDGDAVKMEEVNHAYKLLMKEGGYERLHLRGAGGGNATASARPVGVTAERRRAAQQPFTGDQDFGEDAEAARAASSASRPDGDETPLSDEEVEKLSALDPTTERRTPEGRYLYQNRDDGSWVELGRPLLKASQPRYSSFAAKTDMAEELRRRAHDQERTQNEKTMFQRTVDRLSDSADLPSRNPHFLRVYLAMVIVVLWIAYRKTFARSRHHRDRTQWYTDMDAERSDLLDVYTAHKDGVEASVVTAALLFLAAASTKTEQDPIVPPMPERFYHSVVPPKTHFTVISSV